MQKEKAREVSQVARESVKRLDAANDLLRDEFRGKQKAIQARHELETQQTAQEIGLMNDKAETRQKMHDMLSHVHQNPGDVGVVKEMDEIANRHPTLDLGGIVSEAGVTKHLEVPPRAR